MITHAVVRPGVKPAGRCAGCGSAFMTSSFRIERDSMGELQVPADALWGAQTQRAVQNFPISGLRAPRMASTARWNETSSGCPRRISHTRLRNNSSGYSYASACTSCGSASVTAPQSLGEVNTRINRVPVTSLADFQQVIESLKPGDAIVLNLSTYFRPQNRITSRIVQFTYQ